MKSKLKKIIKRFWLALMILALIITGSIWQGICVAAERGEAEFPGERAQINSREVSYYSRGRGAPTLIFLTGSGTPCAYTDFYALQTEFEKTYQTLSYDKAGFGRSQVAEKPQTIDELTDELEQLLSIAGAEPPYFLVAHSLASLEAIYFAQKHANKVGGIVFLDSGSPEYYSELSQTGTWITNRATAAIRNIGLIRLLGSLGAYLPVGGASARINNLPEDIRQIDRAMYYSKAGNSENLKAIGMINENARAVIEAGKLRDVPVLALSSDGSNSWMNVQRELADWSNVSSQKELKNSGHYIHWTNQAEVIDEIKNFISSQKGIDIDVTS